MRRARKSVIEKALNDEHVDAMIKRFRIMFHTLDIGEDKIK